MQQVIVKKGCGTNWEEVSHSDVGGQGSLSVKNGIYSKTTKV